MSKDIEKKYPGLTYFARRRGYRVLCIAGDYWLVIKPTVSREVNFFESQKEVKEFLKTVPLLTGRKTNVN